jgi:hypothetical protein
MGPVQQLMKVNTLRLLVLSATCVLTVVEPGRHSNSLGRGKFLREALSSLVLLPDFSLSKLHSRGKSNSRIYPALGDCGYLGWIPPLPAICLHLGSDYPGGHCGNQVLSYQITGALNLVTDLMVLAMPMRHLWKLEMRPSQKIPLMCAFAVGLL